MANVELDDSCLDVFVWYSALPGQTVPVSPTEGTVFFQVLSQTLERFYTRHSLQEICTLAADEMAAIGDSERQPVLPKISTLAARVMFNKVEIISLTF